MTTATVEGAIRNRRGLHLGTRVGRRKECSTCLHVARRRYALPRAGDFGTPSWKTRARRGIASTDGRCASTTRMATTLWYTLILIFFVTTQLQTQSNAEVFVYECPVRRRR